MMFVTILQTDNGGSPMPRVLFRAFSILVPAILFFASCSVPNLEKKECSEARETVKQFYSLHFADDLKTDAESLKKIREFLSPRLFDELSGQSGAARNYFTRSEENPRAFRVGGCEALSAGKTVFGVLLFWRSETESQQKEISVETVKQNGSWLIDKVDSKP